MQSIYRGDQGDYTQLGPARSNLMYGRSAGDVRNACEQKGLAPPGGVRARSPAGLLSDA